MESDEDSLWRPYDLHSHCRYSGCRELFTTDRRGMKCAGCKMAYYCGSSCQKLGWAGHREECKAFQRAQRAATVETPPSQRRPNLVQDLNFFVGSIGHIIKTAARSALELGRPESKASTHFLHLMYDYLPPPAERRTLSGKPLGDESTFFTLKSAAALPDTYFDQSEAWGVTVAQKQRHCDAMKREIDESVIFILISACMASDEDTPARKKAINTSATVIRHFNEGRGYYLGFADRKLNPTWELLLRVFADREVPSSEKERHEQVDEVFVIDLVMSETIETLERLGRDNDVVRPNGGWEPIYAEVERLRAMAAQHPPR